MTTRRRAGVFCLAIIWAAASAGAQRAVALNSEQKTAALQAHNVWRARVGTSPLTWSADLAQRAQGWVDTLARTGCRIKISSEQALGENLFYASPLRQGGSARPQVFTAEQVVDAWGIEVLDYSYTRNACAAGRRCGHYTQLVWSTTQEVGCAMTVCADQSQIWACYYRPAGNIARHRPY
jgi:pathogenesis-related protein 1